MDSAGQEMGPSALRVAALHVSEVRSRPPGRRIAASKSATAAAPRPLRSHAATASLRQARSGCKSPDSSRCISATKPSARSTSPAPEAARMHTPNAATSGATAAADPPPTAAMLPPAPPFAEASVSASSPALLPPPPAAAPSAARTSPAAPVGVQFPPAPRPPRRSSSRSSRQVSHSPATSQALMAAVYETTSGFTPKLGISLRSRARARPHCPPRAQACRAVLKVTRSGLRPARTMAGSSKSAGFHRPARAQACIAALKHRRLGRRQLPSSSSPLDSSLGPSGRDGGLLEEADASLSRSSSASSHRRPEAHAAKAAPKQ
mmetsp:Transcript_27326/g.61098  ORF Transcript_27326/g.61098 Transcript_27326/m.61098 type:complete len:320 (-) Transcript_27326:58-1017(-)